MNLETIVLSEKNTTYLQPYELSKQTVAYLLDGNLPINKEDQIANTSFKIIESQKFYANWKYLYPKKNILCTSIFINSSVGKIML